MAHTLKQAAELILTDYLAWFKTGMETGVWLQEGIIDLEGAAGIGKTEILYQISQILKKEKEIGNADVLELFVASAMDPESVAGTPCPVAEVMPDGSIQHVLRMHYRGEIIDFLKKGPGPILFMDEAGREARHMRALLLKLLSPQKTLAGLDMNNMYVVVAGNPADEEHSVDSILEDAAIASRLIRIQVQPSVDELADYLYNRTATHREVANFLLENPTMMLGRDKQGETNCAFHSPRSWTIAASKLHIHGGGTKEQYGSISLPAASAVVTGIVGGQACAALKAYMTKDRPMSVKDIIGGNFKPDVNTNRITSVPPSVMKALQFHIQTKPLTDIECGNLMKFLDVVPSELAATITRDNKRVHPQNMVKFAATGLFNKFIGRVHKRAAKE